MSNTSPPRGRLRRVVLHPVFLVGVVVVVLAAAAGAYWFQPWKLVTNTTVDEALPTNPAEPGSPGAPAGEQSVIVVAEGQFISHEHDTTGTAKLLSLPDGSKVVRLEDLDTSNGPKLVVLLTDSPVIEGRDGWHVFEEGRHVNLGDLKGNRGNANYTVPADVDLAGLDSVSVWCDRFDVSFGAAKLQPV